LGWVEPIIPPMRHPKICSDIGAYLMSTEYFVHDFATMCKKLKPHSRTVFVDMSPSRESDKNLALSLIGLYKKFGFHFDHIYAYQAKETKYGDRVAQIPEKDLSSYHWVDDHWVDDHWADVQVDASESQLQNPLEFLNENFNEEDFIVMKLDIDEIALEETFVMQLMKSETLKKLVDVFYYEHHIGINEMLPYWAAHGVENSTMKESLDLFVNLRKSGVAAHSYI